jgi:hypothetical protein
MLATAWTTPQLPEIRSEIVTAGLKWLIDFILGSGR